MSSKCLNRSKFNSKWGCNAQSADVELSHRCPITHFRLTGLTPQDVRVLSMLLLHAPCAELVKKFVLSY